MLRHKKLRISKLLSFLLWSNPPFYTLVWLFLPAFSNKKYFTMFAFLQYEWKNYSILIGWDQCSSSVTQCKKRNTPVQKVQITHRNSELWLANKEWGLVRTNQIFSFQIKRAPWIFPWLRDTRAFLLLNQFMYIIDK